MTSQNTEIKALKEEKAWINVKIDQIWHISEEENTETALIYIECDDESKYKKKNKGFTLPFSTHAKDNI